MFSSAVPPESGRDDDDRVRCPVAGARTGRHRRYGVRRMRARPVVPRCDRNAALPGEPRSRAGSQLHLRGPCFQRRNRRGTPRQHGTAIRSTHVRARQIQRKVILSSPDEAFHGAAISSGDCTLPCGSWVNLLPGFDRGPASGAPSTPRSPRPHHGRRPRCQLRAAPPRQREPGLGGKGAGQRGHRGNLHRAEPARPARPGRSTKPSTR